MKKILLVIAMVLMAFGVYAATGEGAAYIVPTNGATGSWVKGITITVSDFDTPFAVGNKLIVNFPASMPTPNITPGAAGVTITTKYCVPSAYSLSGQNITLSFAAGDSSRAQVLISYYGGVTIPAAGAYTWGFMTSSRTASNPSSITAKNKAVFTSLALTATPVNTATSTPTPTATTPANKPVTIISGTLLHKGPATLKGLTILSRAASGELILSNAANGGDALTAANIYLTISPAAGVNPVTYEFCEEAEEGIYFDKGIYGYTKVTISSNLNNTINAYFRY